MRLKDLVHRSALRNRSAGDAAVGLPTGMGYQVFEVTGLTIPLGTDWSVDEDGQIGELVVTDPGGLLVSHYLELDADPADFLYFSGFDVLSADYNFDVNIYGGGPLTDDVAMHVQPGGGSTRVGSSGVCDIERTWTSAVGDPPDYPLTIPVGFVTNGPTTADITVVRARLAVLAI